MHTTRRELMDSSRSLTLFPILSLYHGASQHLPRLVRQQQESSGATHPQPMELITPSTDPIPTTSPYITIIDSFPRSSSKTHLTTTRYSMTGGMVAVESAGSITLHNIHNNDTSSIHHIPSNKTLDKHPYPPIFRSFRSNLLPINAGNGSVTLWSLLEDRVLSTFQAITGDTCQGVLVDSTFAAFNLTWDITTNLGRALNIWNVHEPSQPVLDWSLTFEHFIIDVALNSRVVAVALGTYSEGEEEEASFSNTDSSPFNVNLYRRSDGTFLYHIDVLSNIRNILCITMGRLHLYALIKSTSNGGDDDGSIHIRIVDLSTRSLLTSINLLTTFSRTNGGMQLSLDERLLILLCWSLQEKKNEIAVIDIQRGTWRCFRVEPCNSSNSSSDDLLVDGYWVLYGPSSNYQVKWKGII